MTRQQTKSRDFLVSSRLLLLRFRCLYLQCTYSQKIFSFCGFCNYFTNATTVRNSWQERLGAASWWRCYMRCSSGERDVVWQPSASVAAWALPCALRPCNMHRYIASTFHEHSQDLLPFVAVLRLKMGANYLITKFKEHWQLLWKE